MSGTQIDGVFWVKIGFMIVCFLEGFLSGIFPTISKGCRESPKILGVANAFSAGVFLAIALIHILPEEVEGWDNIMTEKGIDDPFPLPYLMVFLGYTLILILEKVLFDKPNFDQAIVDEKGNVVDPAQDKLINAVRASMMAMDRPSMDTKDEAEARNQKQISRQEIADSVRAYLSQEDRFATRMKAAMNKKSSQAKHRSQSVTGDLNDSIDEENLLEPKRRYNPNCEKCVDENPDKLIQGDVVNNKGPLYDDQDCEDCVANAEDAQDKNKKKKCCQDFNFTPYVLMIALCVHSTFEGLALGLCLEMNLVLSICFAIIIHKGAAGSSLGISMVKAFPNDFGLVRRLIAIFALATPVGCAIGMAVAGAGELADVIMSSLAAGTFLYIAASEVIVEEFAEPQYRELKLLFFLIGATIITTLFFIPGS